MGNCCSGERKPQGGQRLGGGSSSTPSAASPGQTLGGHSPGQVVGSQRDAMLQAAEQRRQQAEARGVQQGGGSLSNKLNADRGKKPVPEQRSNSPELVWD